VSPQLVSHCCLAMPVPYFHFHFPAFLKNGPPVPSRRPRSPPEDCCQQKATCCRILWDGRVADEDDEHWEVDEEEVSDEV
jgi:hypothetical protein